MTETCLTLRPLTNEIELVDRWLRKRVYQEMAWFGRRLVDGNQK